jgi:lipid A 3-O-deacylase
MQNNYGLTALFMLLAWFVATKEAKTAEPTRRSTSPAYGLEGRFGLSWQDPGGPEEGSLSLAGEILFPKPFRAEGFADFLVPRLHLGGSTNLQGDTSFAYAGFAWTWAVTETVFIEGALGAGIHNGETGRFAPTDRLALGCSPLFREAAAIGYHLTERLSLLAQIEHLSNAGLCDANRGLTNLGLKLGYKF